MTTLDEHIQTGIPPRLTFNVRPAAVYAIGDVHGCLAQLQDLESQIIADAATIRGEKWLVMLGDYLDRGPDPAGVVAHLLAPPPQGFTRFALRGNHEQAMLDFLDAPSSNADWLEWGHTTLSSYGVKTTRLDAWFRSPEHVAARLGGAMPPSHLQFLNGLAAYLALPGYIFVHAGLRPGVALERQTLTDLLWIRDEFHAAPRRPDVTVVHGHTPIVVPDIMPGRINIDTGCFHSGVLTGARILADDTIRIMQAGPR